MSDILIRSGIDISTILLLLMLPVTATMIGFARHIIGLRSLGIYLCLIITFIFFKLGSIPGTFSSDPMKGFSYGLFLILIIFVTTAFFYLLFKNWAIHYYPKLSIIITAVTATLISLIIISGLLKIEGLLQIDAFTLILIVGVSEKYMSILTRKNLKATIFISLESIGLAAICYLVISWRTFQELLLTYPYLILLILPVNYLVGRFTGLRLSEYFRFWDILNKKE